MTDETLEEIERLAAGEVRTYGDARRLAALAVGEVRRLRAANAELSRRAVAWIPVEERLPEDDRDGRHVLVWYAGLCDVGWYGNGEWYAACASGCKPDEPVTHWMPLPEGPKGD
jgi:hypothetical protein